GLPEIDRAAAAIEFVALDDVALARREQERAPAPATFPCAGLLEMPARATSTPWIMIHPDGQLPGRAGRPRACLAHPVYMSAACHAFAAHILVVPPLAASSLLAGRHNDNPSIRGRDAQLLLKREDAGIGVGASVFIQRIAIRRTARHPLIRSAGWRQTAVPGRRIGG